MPLYFFFKVSSGSYAGEHKFLSFLDHTPFSAKILTNSFSKRRVFFSARFRVLGSKLSFIIPIKLTRASLNRQVSRRLGDFDMVVMVVVVMVVFMVVIIVAMVIVIVVLVITVIVWY